MLVEVRRRSNIGRNHATMQTNAVDLNRQQNWHAHLVQLACEIDGSLGAQTLTAKDNPRCGALFAIQFAVAVPIQRALNEFVRDSAMAVGNRLRIDSRSCSQFECDLANAAMRIVPVVDASEKANYEGASRLNRPRRWKSPIAAERRELNTTARK